MMMFRMGARCECRSYVSVLVGSMFRTTSQAVLSTDQLEQTEALRNLRLAVTLICPRPGVESAQERKWAGQEKGVPFPLRLGMICSTYS